ncbi:hypothetical protein BTO30_04350 [Domibacillus antri]|uniref:Uncharacterized protein n=1 Tax=Domibacillus antri TaxID=1714264 RepID=A0A1Q8Q798_9BACI|nr:DUF1798 family protein [Domibacillus antri]OLN23209.1 hypothetical protein BTO30_04350 [Domibacillus antri]
MHLTDKTKTLQSLVKKAKLIYEERRESKEEADFFGVVKPFADEMDKTAEEWEKAALEWLKSNPQKYVHGAQIIQAADNARRVGAHAHFFDTGKVKFIQSADSALYVLESLSKILNRD